jgi:hypothetical protein
LKQTEPSLTFSPFCTSPKKHQHSSTSEYIGESDGHPYVPLETPDITRGSNPPAAYRRSF